jgi:hypothetical protein
MNDWDLDSSLYNFLSLLNNWEWFFNNSLDLLNNISINNFLNDNLHWFNDFLDRSRLNKLLNDLRNLNDNLFNLDDWNWFFNDSLYDPMLYLHIWNALFFDFIDYSLDYLLDYLFHFDNLRDLDTFFYDLFDNYWYFHNPLYNFLNWRNNLLNIDDNFLRLWYKMIDLFLNCDNPIDLYNFINQFLNFYNLGYFSSELYNFLINGWHLNDFLDCMLKWHNFFDDVVNYCWYFHTNIDNSFNFPYFLNFHNLFNYSLYSDYLRNFNYSVDYLLDDLLNFNYLWNNSKDFKDIVNIYDTHDLLIN